MEWLMSLDGDILLWIQENIRKEFLSPAVERITHLGDAGWFWIALLAFMLFFSKCRKTAATGLLAVLIGFLITNLWLKNMVARVRPYEIVEGLQLIGNRAVDFSFPSGHSTCSVAASTVLFCRFPKWIGAPALVLALLICFSRLYIGIHYPTDVMAGMLIGMASAFLAMRIMRNWEGRDQAVLK